MSELFTRAVNDLDTRRPDLAQDASRALIEEVRHGADRYQLAAAVNQKEAEPGHAGVQIRVGQDANGYLAFVPINGYQGDQAQVAPPMDVPPQQTIIQQAPPNDNGFGAGVVTGVIGTAILGAVLGGGHGYYHRRPEPPRYYNNRY